MTDFGALLRALHTAGVDFIVIGGVAATVHGSTRLTVDLDVVYSRTPDNLRRLARALQPLDPYLRGAPPGLPFTWDETTIGHGLNFTLTTIHGDLNLLGEATGGGTWDSLLPDSLQTESFGLEYRVVTLRRLIALKRAAGRPKDLDAVAELELIREQLEAD